MSHLSLTLFGQFQIVLDDQLLSAFESDKVRALLCYLAAEPVGTTHSRTTLAALLWPGYSDVSARTNLRQTLYHLRKILRDDRAHPFLRVTRQIIQFNPAASCHVDVRLFSDLLTACAAHAHPEGMLCPDCLQRLHQAVDLYQGDFLAGFAIEESDPFEEWRRFKQEHLHIQALHALTQLAYVAEVAGDDMQARYYAQRQLALEPWHEQAHRQLMRLFAQSGQRTAALVQYQTCCQALFKEFGVEPDPETTALYEQIRSGVFKKVPKWQSAGAPPDERPLSPSPLRLVTQPLLHNLPPTLAKVSSRTPLAEAPGHPVTTTPIYDWGEMPTVDFFQGRSPEMAQLEQWLAPAHTTELGGRVQLVSLLGIGGIGKTTLAAAVTKTVAPAFAVVIWRSLLNAPPLPEILRNWLQILTHQTLIDLPTSLDEQLRLLLGYLRQQRCLLVLDNLESILLSGEGAGQLRLGYEGYEQLLQQLATSDHNSCLLLTSREQPYALARISGQTRDFTGRIRVLPLAGLDVVAGHTILHSNGLRASPQEAALLVKNYSGNPLALQIVANTIVDLFSSDIAAFQREEGFIFDGIRTVLDQQFVRLTPLEREILIWLAIERECITVQTLRQNLVQPVTTVELLEALHALQHRSLLEKIGDGLTLQNVIIEYLTELLIEWICTELSDKSIRWQTSVLQAAQDDVNTGRTPLSPSPHPVRLSVRTQRISVADGEVSRQSLSLSWLNRFSLLKAQAKEYIRQSQARLLLQPVAERLVAKLGKTKVVAQLQHMIQLLHREARLPGYACGNLLNLLLYLRVDLAGYDFSNLCVWQADLRGAHLATLNFAEADLAGSTFTLTFDAQAVKFHQSSEIMVAGLIEGDLYLWQAVNGQLVDAFRSASNGGYPMIFSPNGQLIAAHGLDHVIRIWSTTNGQRLQRLQGHTSTVYSLAMNNDGTLLASGTSERLVRLWDVHTGHLLQTFDGHENGVGALAFTPAGDRLASGGSDHAIRLWHTRTASAHDQPVTLLQGHTREISALAFSPDGTLLASAGHDGSLRLWDHITARCLQTLQGHASIIRTLLFHPAGHLLASGSADCLVRLWDVQTGQLLHTLVGHTYEVESLSFSEDGCILASSGADQRVYLWDTQGGRVLTLLHAYKPGVPAACFSPDGQSLASGSPDGLIHLWHVQSGQIKQTLKGHQTIRALAFRPVLNPDVVLLASGGLEQSVRLWNLTIGKEIHALPGHTGLLTAIAFSPDGARLASAANDKLIRLWSVTENLHLKVNHHQRLLGHQADITALAFSPDGRMLVSSSHDHTACIWHVEHDQPRYVLRGHTASVSCAVFHPDGRTVATISFDHTLRFWDATTGACLAVQSDESIGDRVVLFSPDGELFAYGGADFAIYLRQWRTGELRHTLQGHKNFVGTLAFSPTEPLLVSGSWDNTVRLWDLATGVCRQILRSPGPYTGMNITGVTGISAAQKAALKALGAVEE